MTLPDLTKMDISKKMVMAMMGAYFVKEIENFKLAVVVAILVGVAIVCQTAIDIVVERGKT